MPAERGHGRTTRGGSGVMREHRGPAAGRNSDEHPRRAGETGRTPGTQHETDTRTGRAVFPLLPALGLLALGCRGLSPSVLELTPPPSRSPMRLVEGDAIEIKFFYAPELNETQAIRPDGKISLELAGEVNAAGRTPEELCEHLRQVYTSQLLDATAVVLVRSYAERRVLVSGAVTRPGQVAMPGRMTVLEAIMLAGGFDATTAETRSVLLIRRAADGRYVGSALDMRRAIRGAPTSPVYLEPRDIIHVPRTRIVKINQWISQHVGAVAPNLGVTFSRRISEADTVGVSLDGRP